MDTKSLRALIVLPYYNRPNLVRNALSSVLSQTDPNWELAFIDDGSIHPGAPIVEEIFGPDPRVSLYRIEDSAEEKIIHGSRHGEFMNLAIGKSTADFVIILCDDDALVADCVANFSRYFLSHPEEVYCYSHVRIYDPRREAPGPSIPKRPYFTNLEIPVAPSCRLDSSQVVYRRECAETVPYLPRVTANQDMYFYDRMAQEYGPCRYAGFDGQYKGLFPDQLGQRDPSNWYNVKVL